MRRAKLAIGQFLCRIGLHNWKYTPERSRYSFRVNMICKRICKARSSTIKHDVIGRNMWGYKASEKQS